MTKGFTLEGDGEVAGYLSLYQRTSGLFGNIYTDFSSVLDGIATMIGANVNDGSWIVLDSYDVVKLSEPYKTGSSTDTDGDGMPDAEELLSSKKTSLQPYISVYLKARGLTYERYLELGGNPYIDVYSYRSRPDKYDTDGDGLNDKKDSNPREWDVSDRDLAMCAALCYENGTVAKSSGRFYRLSEIEGDRNGGEAGESYYFYGLAHISEMEEQWKVVDYTEDNRVLKIDNFSATTYKNGKNVIIAYRGTNENLEWLDNVVCYGLGNYHTEEAQARAYVKNIVKRYPGCKFYITGHSLGGYLAQIGTAELVQSDLSANLVKTAYFNGIGVAFNPTLAILKINDKIALYRFSHDFLTSNHKLISYAIRGDWVHNLGTHQGDKVEYYAAAPCIAHHRALASAEYEGLTFMQAFLKAFGGSVVDVAGLALSTVAASPTTAIYFAYYGVPDFVRFTWITHETDSFFAYLLRDS